MNPPTRKRIARPPPTRDALSYRIDDAAIVIGASRATIYRMIADGALRKLTLYGRTLVDGVSLRDMINRPRQAADAAR